MIRDALEWVVRLKSGEATLLDAEQMIAWRVRSPAHEQAFRNAVRCWQAIGPGLADLACVEDTAAMQSTDITHRS